MLGKRIGAVLLGVFVPLAIWGALAQAVPPKDAPPHAQASAADSLDAKADVPALRAMHEVIYPLWHKAWPAKDTQMIKDLLPKVRAHVEAVRTAALPGILRDHKDEWDAGVLQLVEAEKTCEDAAAKSDKQGLLDAVEDLHARFESLMGVTSPVFKQLDDYHVVLYKIYHGSMPAKDLAKIRAQSVELAARAKALSDVPLPKRFADKEKEIKSGITLLWTDTEALRLTAQKDDLDAIGAAVEKVHASYRTLDELFR
jgi:hypothetical protein